MPSFHHQPLPASSTLLSGNSPRDASGFQSTKLQIWYNHTQKAWKDSGLHYHTESDEIFIVLEGTLVVEVEGQRFEVGPREFCCFPAGLPHAIVEVHPPVESLMIRAPSLDDKVHLAEG